MADDSAPRCRWCGGPQHINAMTGQPAGIYCPMVKAFNFNPAGDIVRVEFLTPRDWGTNRVDPEDEPGVDYPRMGST